MIFRDTYASKRGGKDDKKELLIIVRPENKTHFTRYRACLTERRRQGIDPKCRGRSYVWITSRDGRTV